MAEAILSQPHFQDPDKAREYLEALRWPEGAICPHCGVVGGHYQLQGASHRPGLWKCKDCRNQFSVTVGTVFEDSKVPLHKWLQAVHLMCASKKGISSKQLERMLGVTYKTAWFMSHRIREAMRDDEPILGGAGGIVEADETFVGRRRPAVKRRGQQKKQAVFSLVERSGKVRSIHVPDVTAATLKEHLQKHVARDTRLVTDNAGQYRKAKSAFQSHETVNHLHGEYARGDVHTNTVEGYFSIMKRGIFGVFQHVSSQHLQRYATEFDFRYNNRAALGVDDVQRTANALRGIAGRRLTYRM